MTSGDAEELANMTATAAAPFPPFYEGNIKNWFLQMEAIFIVRKITDQKAKFGHVVAVLSPAIVDEVSDFLEAVPEVEPYARLKEAIRRRMGRTEETLICELFSNLTYECRIPSQLLRFMKSRLGKNTMADTILKSLWLDRLPTTNAQILAPMSENTPLDQLADAADRIFSQLDHQTTPLHSAEAASDHRSLENAVEDLQRQVRDLTLALKSCGRSQFPSRWRFRSRPHSCSRNKDVPSSTMCYYHCRFGSAAHYCTKPCTYTAVVENKTASE
ncbi:unnamed protein product [Acanthosepion pharaonis]|uniref:DUF7041 domain-containing protein n=1 Tax=Acanthosepion pharaonis TaxID=158019 RepID=A0A812BI15_ACAPH|nr:unnamed protein product [Sepia pharaonis]